MSDSRADGPRKTEGDLLVPSERAATRDFLRAARDTSHSVKCDVNSARPSSTLGQERLRQIARVAE